MPYLPYIDGLRGIAVLAILLFHLDVSLFQGGFIGVDLFFVISGYLITSIIMREMREGRFSFAAFYARRVRRIFPALFVMLFFASVGAVLFLGLLEFGDYFKAVRYAAAQVSNFLFSQEVDYFAPDVSHSPLLHTWSLGVEEQFYLIWPMVLLAAYKFLKRGDRAGRLLVPIFFASLLISEYLVRTDGMQAFYHLHSRAWQLALGGIVALDIIGRPRGERVLRLLPAAGLILMTAPVFLYDEQNFPGLKALVPCLGIAMILYAGRHAESAVTKMLAFKPLISVGVISYSVYLWHWPLIAFYKTYFASGLTPQAATGIAAATFGIAYLSYRFIEQPFRKHKFSSAKTLGTAFILILCFIGASNVVKRSSDAPWRVTYEINKLERSPHSLDRICSVESGAYDRETCIVGPNKGSYEVILTGDSHASHYAPMIFAWAKERGYTVRLFTRGACPAWVMPSEMRFRYGRPDTYCMQLTEDFYKTLERDKSIEYVFIGLSDPSAKEDVRRSLERLGKTGKKVVYLGRVTKFAENPHDCQVRHNLMISKIFPKEPVNCLAFDPSTYEKSRTEFDYLKAISEGYGIPYFDPTEFMREPIDGEGHFLYMDKSHMNLYGGGYLAPYFSKFMKAQEEKRPAFR
ncbi:MAG: hypothetical protein DI626_04015 [Micavibrio aeruginosavorus]|uniref:Acyltransferase n=1 Tax=Micavibrio aeruginosavorus TaxID=349221 RepID=A0A2W4ZYL2_9BACT|nr:MAG: hypothetical protein DI626_04015 [Micavibrio aeruginosavorus]